MYLLDIETVLQVLSRQSGLLQTDLQIIPGTRIRKPCRVLIHLASGKVESCSIQTRDNNVLLEGMSALDRLRQLGEFEWIFTPSTSNSVPTPEASTSSDTSTSLVRIQQPEIIHSAFIPYRSKQRFISQEEMRSWSRLYRQTFALIDGQKSSMEIARILGRSVEEIIAILHLLRKQRIIE